MYLAPLSSIRKLSDSPLSANSASAVARCTQAHAKYCCCSRRALRAQSHRLTTGTANCTSRSQFHPTNCPTGSRGSSSEGSPWKRNVRGNRAAGAFTFGTPTATCSNSPLRVRGRCTENTGRWESTPTAVSHLATHSCRCCLTRLDVFVEAEQIGRVVLVLQRNQSRILLPAIGILDSSGALVGLPPQIVNVHSPGREGLHSIPEVPCPSDALRRFGRFGAHTQAHEAVLCIPLTERGGLPVYTSYRAP